MRFITISVSDSNFKGWKLDQGFNYSMEEDSIAIEYKYVVVNSKHSTKSDGKKERIECLNYILGEKF